MLWDGVGLPALMSAAVLLMSWPLTRLARTARSASWPMALALGTGCAAGQVAIEGGRAFPPREAADRLFSLMLAAVVLSLLDGWRSWPRWLRGAVGASLWLAVVWYLLPPAIRKEASRGELVSWLAGLGLGGLLFAAVLSLTARRFPDALVPLILLIVSAGTVGVLSRGHSVTLTQLAGVFVAALVPLLIRSTLRPAVVLPTLPVLVLLLGLWLRSHFYDYEPPPAMSFLLLAAATFSGGLTLLPGIRNLAAWQRLLLSALAASLLVWWAVNAASVPKADEDLLVAPSVNRRVTIK